MVCVKTTSWNQHQSLLTLPFAFGGFLKERSLMEDKEIRAFILLTFFQTNKETYCFVSWIQIQASKYEHIVFSYNRIFLDKLTL